MKSSSIVISSALHISLVILTALSLPFLSKKPIDLPPIVSVELIQIAEETNIPFAPKAKKIIAKVLAVSKNRTDTRIYVRGDKTINYGRVLELSLIHI